MSTSHRHQTNESLEAMIRIEQNNSWSYFNIHQVDNDELFETVSHSYILTKTGEFDVSQFELKSGSAWLSLWSMFQCYVSCGMGPRMEQTLKSKHNKKTFVHRSASEFFLLLNQTDLQMSNIRVWKFLVKLKIFSIFCFKESNIKN